ncbi:MAG TPA: CocE/NonD family hydrolase [Solirubrobacter sp.]|nr:CocE/NonD family hydrolase [Solirubrobacter sp.]
MRPGRLVCAVTVAMTIVATSGASAQTFRSGMAQPVLSGDPGDWVDGEVWVESDSDSDGDGRRDRIHVDFTLPDTNAKVPVIYQASPYFAGIGTPSNWLVDHALGAPSRRPPQTPFKPFDTSPNISSEHEAVWVPRGFAVVHSESPGTGESDGCPSAGGPNETLAATAVIDWLNGRRPAFTSRAGSRPAPLVDWHNGRTAMVGTSYDGTLAVAAAATGVEGLAAIVPVSAISDWYDYYRANGLVRAPHSRPGGTGPNAFQGEDLDVLADALTARRICRPATRALKRVVGRDTGDRTAVWRERAFDLSRIKAATLVAHGGDDFNVMTKHAAQLYEAVKANGTPHLIYLHRGGHGGEPPHFLTNLWLTRYLWGVENGVEALPRAWVVREPAFCPSRTAIVVGIHSRTRTLTVNSAAALRVGLTVTLPGAGERVIAAIPDPTQVTLNARVRRVADGARLRVRCGPANPTPYAEWPDPSAADTVINLRGAPVTFTDNGRVRSATALLRDRSHRFLHLTAPLPKRVRISGTPRVTLKVAFSKPRANLSVALVRLPDGKILTRGWIDPQNRTADAVSEPVVPATFYTLTFALQPKDVIVPAGRRLGLMVFSTDREYTIRPAPGTRITLDPRASTLTLPLVCRQECTTP